MHKIIRKTFISTILLSSILYCFSAFTSKVSAQQTLPGAGSGFVDAVQLMPGDYQSGFIAEYSEGYYYININAGQELQVIFEYVSDGSVVLTFYNSNEEEMYKIDTFEIKETLNWLSKTSEKYYLVFQSNWDIESLSLNISFSNRYDAGSTFDAPDNFDSSMLLNPGEYSSYFVEDAFYTGGSKGNDLEDYYKTAVKSGSNLVVKVSPPSNSTAKLTIYDEYRGEVFTNGSENNGQIITGSVTVYTSGYMYIVVSANCDYTNCDGNIVNYQMSISGSEESAGATGGTDGTTTLDDLTNSAYNFNLPNFQVSSALKTIIIAISCVVGLFLFVIAIIFFIKQVTGDKKPIVPQKKTEPSTPNIPEKPEVEQTNQPSNQNVTLKAENVVIQTSKPISDKTETQQSSSVTTKTPK